MSEMLGLLKRRHWQGGGGCLEACVREQTGWCISTAQHLGGREKDQEFKGNLSFAVNLRPAGLWGGGGERFLIRTYHSLNSVQIVLTFSYKMENYIRTLGSKKQG